MIHFFNTKIGRLRIIGFLEGVSLLALVCIAVPMKYIALDPTMTKTLGPIHGALFILFLLNTISCSIEQQWKPGITWKILLSCFIPFGTFYIDYKILKNLNSIKK